MPQPRPEWRDPAKERYWRRFLEQWRRSGLTGRDFCAQHHVSEHSFYGWKREIARRDHEQATATPALPRRPAAARRGTVAAQPAFVQVEVPRVPTAALEVVLAGGRVLRVSAGFEAAVLRQLLAVLEEPPC